VFRLCGCDAGEGDRIGMEEEVQVLVMRTRHASELVPRLLRRITEHNRDRRTGRLEPPVIRDS
jgi:hypothetical protein